MVVVVLPLRIESVANLREGWAARYRRAKKHKAAAIVVPRHPLPCVVMLTRIAPRPLDGHDNLRSGLKGLVDGIAARLGVADNDPRVEWRYAQERGRVREYAVRIEITGAP